MTDTFPVLYILMRVDLESLNPGKGMAQASHASNAFMKEINDGHLDSTLPEPIERLSNEWRLKTNQGFGTVLVLGVNEVQMRAAIQVAKTLGFLNAIVHDPTYPLRDGDFTHFIPLDTCAYIFGDKNDPMLQAVIGHFELHP